MKLTYANPCDGRLHHSSTTSYGHNNRSAGARTSMVPVFVRLLCVQMGSHYQSVSWFICFHFTIKIGINVFSRRQSAVDWGAFASQGKAKGVTSAHKVVMKNALMAMHLIRRSFSPFDRYLRPFRRSLNHTINAIELWIRKRGG